MKFVVLALCRIHSNVVCVLCFCMEQALVYCRIGRSCTIHVYCKNGHFHVKVHCISGQLSPDIYTLQLTWIDDMFRAPLHVMRHILPNMFEDVSFGFIYPCAPMTDKTDMGLYVWSCTFSHMDCSLRLQCSA